MPNGRSAWRYSAYSGGDDPLSIGADDLMSAMADDLAYHGDLAAALRRLLNEGFSTKDGRRVEGLQQMLERIRRRREQLAAERSELERHVEEELEAIEGLERQAIEQLNDPGDGRLGSEADRKAAQEHEAALELMGRSLAERVESLMHYDFLSKQAEQRFFELIEKLRHDLLQSQLDQAAAAMGSASEQERQHLREGLDALNKMLEQRAAGEPLDPSFEQFMQQYGDLFPGDAKNLDELLEQLAQRMAAASAMVAAMTPEQRAQLQSLSEQLLSDMDLAWQLDRLGSNLREALPQMSWDRPLGPGGDPISMIGASDTISELAELAELSDLLGNGADVARLSEVDPEAAERLLGKDVAQSLKALSELTRRLEEAGLVNNKAGRLELSPEGLRRLGQHALSELYGQIRKERFGDHPVGRSGSGHDRDIETKAYEFGDPFRLELQTTLRNAIRRLSSEQAPGRRALELPIRLELEDFAIEQTEQLSTASTVLCIDLSLSMPMRDNFLSAKKVALALQSLIATRYPRDYLGLVGFSATAREIRRDELPEVSWDFAYGTNLQHALALSRKLLAHAKGTKQIIVVTDGEPTAHITEEGEVYFNYPPVKATLDATLREVVRCTREKIIINTFVLDETGGLRSFVAKMTELNRGRSFLTTPQSLGDYLLVDFVEHRSPRRRRMRPA